MRGVLFVLLAAVCFGTTGTAQALGPDVSPVSLGAARIVIGGGALALIAWAAARRTPRHSLADRGRFRLPTWLIIAIGAAGIVTYQPAFFLGTAENGVAIGTVVALGSAPVITGALDWALTRRYPGTPWLIATVISAFGVALLGGILEAGASGISAVGLAGSIGAGASYAVYTLAAKALLVRGWRADASMGALFGTAAAASLPILLLTDVAWLGTPAGIAMALWLGLITTTLGYVLFGRGLALLSAPTVSTLTLAEPLTASLLALLVLQEQLSASGVAGFIVLAAGLVVLSVASARHPHRKAASVAAHDPRETPR
ncbi:MULTISPECIES: EamA family transporter [unclassified Diaminobutyricimonas]|uniref:DMT family transporter n=1 Tax=unclassified Diaminobutyricimonas TaxID=2643261 RepID=UPI0012F51D6D|nr:MULTISPECIES: EamA family transporter [unclassified Diaminobutyricimonas]